MHFIFVKNATDGGSIKKLKFQGKSSQPPKPRRRRKRAQGNADPMRLDTSVAEGEEGESSDGWFFGI